MYKHNIMMNRFLSFFLCGVFFFSSGCSLSSSNESTQPSASISVYALSPETSDLNVFINDANVATSLPFGSYTLYSQIAAGSTRLKAQTSSLDQVNEVQFTTTAGSYYSVFLIDSGNNKLKSLVVTDNINTITDDSVHLRFFNFSPDVPAINLSWYSDSINSANHKTIWKNRIYDSIQPADSINTFITAKTGVYNFYALKTSNGDTLARFTNKNLATSGYYTLVLEGRFATGDTALQLGIRKH